MSEDPKDEEIQKPSEETLLESWQTQFGDEKTNSKGLPYWQLQAKDYKEAFSSLLNSMLYAGYSEADVRSATFLRKLQEACTKDITSTAKLKGWKNMVEETWKWIVARHFADKNLIKPATNFAAEEALKAKEKAEARAKMTAEQIAAEEAPPEPYVSPKNRVDPHAEGYGDADIVYDDTFAKIFEKLKNE